MTKKGKRKNHHDDLHVSHPDEKWLVSYADMMTLLFGFFVLMFSLAVKNKGDFKSGLKEISNEMDQSKAKASSQGSQMESVPLVEYKKVEAEKNTALQNAEELQKKLDQLNLIFQDQPQTANELQRQKHEVESLQDQLKAVQALNEQKEKDNATLIEQKELELSQLKKLVQQLNAASKVKASDTEKVDLNKDFNSAIQKIAELERLLTDLRSRNYMMAFVKWDTEKHDIDMTVKDPEGHIFDFKRRTYPNISGNLILDSRYGPGVEVWNSNKVAAGDYEIIATLYNQFGNPNDAVITGSIVTGYGMVELPKSYLNMKDQPRVVFKLNVSAEGKVSLK